jgi:sugar phosphate isomerase/epimerase
MAIDHGFEAISAMPGDLHAFSDDDLAGFLEKMKAHDISWGSANLPVDFRQDRTTFENGLTALPQHAGALERAGATRMNTWIMPTHAELTYSENFYRHSIRLRACASVLADHGVQLGLEYVGPKTLLTRSRYPFLRTMKESRELIDAIGASNVGLVLDSFHWYCAEDSVEDILALTDVDIVTCDLNDARSDLSRDEQIDGTRELPGATGVIDLKGFLNALAEIGYSGPVRAEPFNQPLRDMEDKKAIEATYKALSTSFALIE